MKTFSEYLIENSRANILAMKSIVHYLLTDGMKSQETFVGGVMTLSQHLQKLSGLPNPKLKRLVAELQKLASTWQKGQPALQIRQTLQMLQIELDEYENDLFS
jgi:hypothetical protein